MGCIYPTSREAEALLTVALVLLRCSDHCSSLKSKRCSWEALPAPPASSHSPEDARVYRELTKPHRSGSPGQILCSRSLESKNKMETSRKAPAGSSTAGSSPPAKPRGKGPGAQHSMKEGYWEHWLRHAECGAGRPLQFLPP